VCNIGLATAQTRFWGHGQARKPVPGAAATDPARTACGHHDTGAVTSGRARTIKAAEHPRTEPMLVSLGTTTDVRAASLPLIDMSAQVTTESAATPSPGC
jgi:hypothetical protein